MTPTPRKLVIRGPAKTDLARAAVWYRKQRPGLDEEFVQAVLSRLRDIVEHPALHPVRYKADIRRALVQRFPYAILFVDAPPKVTVLAIAHTSRDISQLLDDRG